MDRASDGWHRAAATASPPIEPRRAAPADALAPSERGDRSGDRPDDSGRSSERTAERRVLVIEDEPDIRDLLSYNLQSGGFQVKTAETGTRGLALF